jgi:hypothetical protein
MPPRPKCIYALIYVSNGLVLIHDSVVLKELNEHRFHLVPRRFVRYFDIRSGLYDRGPHPKLIFVILEPSRNIA